MDLALATTITAPKAPIESFPAAAETVLQSQRHSQMPPSLAELQKDNSPPWRQQDAFARSQLAPAESEMASPERLEPATHMAT